MDLHREVLAAAERAADAAHAQPHLVVREAEALGDLVAVDVQPLRGDVQVDAALVVRDREAGLGAEEGLVLHPDLVGAGDDDRRGRVRVAVVDPQVAQRVAGQVQLRRVRLHRRFGVGQRRQDLVFDLDRLHRAARGLGIVGGDDRDRLALVADRLPGQHGLVRDLHPVGLAAGDVVVGEHGAHAGHRDGRAGVDRPDVRARMRAAQRRAPQHPVDVHVARVLELAADLRHGVDPRGGRADAAGRWTSRAGKRRSAHAALRCTIVRLCDATLTASMIFS